MLCNESRNFNLSVSLATQRFRIKTGKKSGNHNSIFYRGNRGSWIHTISEYCPLTWCQNRQELKERFSGRKWLFQNGSPEICGRSDSQPKTPRRISNSLIHSAHTDSLLSTCWLLTQHMLTLDSAHADCYGLCTVPQGDTGKEPACLRELTPPRHPPFRTTLWRLNHQREGRLPSRSLGVH